MKNKNWIVCAVISVIFAQTGMAMVTIEDGVNRLANYSGGLSAATNYTDTVITNPALKIYSDGGFDVANQNFSAMDFSSAVSLDIEIYGDNSGQTFRFSLWATDLGNPFFYKDVVINWTGWQSFSWNLDGSDGGFDFWPNGTSATASDAIKQITVFSIQEWNPTAASTIFIDNVRMILEEQPPIDADYNQHHDNLINNPYAEYGFTDWYHSTNASIADHSASVGTKCFQLTPGSSPFAHSDIRSIVKPIDAGQYVQFQYSFMSGAGSTIQPASSYAMFRCFDENDNYCGGVDYPLEITGGSWQNHSHQILVPEGTVSFDVLFSIDMNDAGAAAGDFYVDDIKLYRAAVQIGLVTGIPTKLYVIRQNTLNNQQFLMMQSLQGILAQTKPEIYIDHGDTTYLDDLVANHGITMTRSDSIYFYFNRYKNMVDGYVLYDITDQQSMLAASSLSGIMKAVMVDVTLESSVIGYGLSKLIDVRGKNCQWVYDNYWSQFNKNGIVMKQPDVNLDGSAYWYRDMPIALKLMWWWDSSQTLTAEVFDRVIDSSLIHGWDNPAAPGELGATEYHSNYSLFTNAVAAVSNVSTLSAMAGKYPDKQYHQKISDKTYTKESGVHYVAFMLSDMDNTGTELGPYGFHINSLYFGNSHRGEFPMGWGMPPSFVEMAPTVMEWWYRNATDNDGFSAPASGLGYMYPEKFPDLEHYSRKLDELMRRADEKTVVLSGKMLPQEITYENYYDTAHQYSRLESVRGMYYIDVNGDYAGQHGKILWFDGKPFVTCRFTLWDGSGYEGVSRNASQLAATLNAQPKTPDSPAGYSLVFVHAWSYGLDEVAATVAALDPNVRVVTPDEMIEQIYMNLTSCGQAPVRSDINNDCQVDLADYSVLADNWLTVSSGAADIWDDGVIDDKDMIKLASQWLE